jgi:predicted nucleic acid-binding protein
MVVRFVDTYYLLALVNPRDQGHANALQHSRGDVHHLVTTTWVLVEFADALSAVASRRRAARFIRGFESDPSVEVVPPSRTHFEQGLAMYESRRDKEWSLTDCLSFVLMQEHGITDALTADHHFEQAGFVALLK